MLTERRGTPIRVGAHVVGNHSVLWAMKGERIAQHQQVQLLAAHERRVCQVGIWATSAASCWCRGVAAARRYDRAEVNLVVAQRIGGCGDG